MKFKNREQTIRYRLSYLKRQRKLFLNDAQVAQRIKNNKQLDAAVKKIIRAEKSMKILKEKLDKIDRKK